MTEFDHINLDQTSRALICKACHDSPRVWLSPLDKGLSGSSVWLAQWQLVGGGRSKYHVFKIGNKRKLQAEYQNVVDIASVLIQGFPLMTLHDHSRSNIALLRQEFVGGPSGAPKSLRQFLNECSDTNVIKKTFRRLYLEVMASWYTESAEVPNSGDVTTSLGNAMDRWVAKINLPAAAREIGHAELDKSLRRYFRTGLADMEARIRLLCRLREEIRVGPVHGDLHAQNVLVDPKGGLHLIDFGWTDFRWRLVDFIMMECSLKFVVSPAHAQLQDLIELERLLDKSWGMESTANFTGLKKLLHGKKIVGIAEAIGIIRSCARKCRAVRDKEQYRRGLILLTAALSSIPTLINRVFLFHSLGYHLAAIRGR